MYAIVHLHLVSDHAVLRYQGYISWVYYLMSDSHLLIFSLHLLIIFAIGLSDACDQIDLLLGMVVFDTSVNATFLSKFPLVFQPFLPFMQLFYEEPIQTAKSISINSYSPAFAGIFSSTIGPTSNQRARQMLDSTWRKHAYQYTYTDSFGYGKVITYRIYR